MIIFFILIFITTAKATEDTKYIDLLPENEKEIFLERIARRILEEVESNPIQQKTLDVTKDELDVHSEFVKKILKEEEANLRKRNLNDKEDLSVKPLDGNRKDIDLTIRSRTRRNNNGSFDGNSNLEDNGAQSDVKTQFIKDSSSKSDEKDIQIKDFNVKSKDNDPKVEPEANNDDVQTISTDKVSVETKLPITEHQDNVEKVKNNTINFNDANEIIISTANTETNQSLSIDLDTKMTSKAEGNDSSFRKRTSQDINDDNKKENKLIEGDNISTEKHDNEPKITTEQVKEALRNMTFLDIPVQVLREDTVTNMEETSRIAITVPTREKVTNATTEKQVAFTVETATVKSELETKENIKRDVSDVSDKIYINDSGTEVSSFKPNNLNFGDSENIKMNTADNNNTNNNLFIDVETTLKSSIDVDLKTIQVKPLTKTYNSDKNAEIVSASIENMDVVAEVNPKLITDDKILQDNIKGTLKSDLGNINDDDSIKPKIYHIEPYEGTTQKIEVLTPLIPLTSTFNTKNEVKHTKEVDSNIIQVLRDVIERNKVKANGRFTGVKPNPIKIKEHEVYEIPKEKTLVIDDISNKEQPYYYPIYNYSPDNAYYNGHNNLGPNQEDLGIKRIKTQDQRISNFQTDYFFDDDDNNNRKIRFGYSDGSEHKDKYHVKLPVVVKYPFKVITDYEDPDISRSKGKAKKKDDDEENNIKSSLREIRIMMYSKKHFGYMPENKTYYTSAEVSPSNDTTEKSILRAKFEAILEREKNERQKRIITDDTSFDVKYYNSRINDNTKTDNIKQKNIKIPILKDLQKIFNKIYFIDPSYLKSKKKEIARCDENKPNFEKIKKILDMGNDVDAIPNLNKLLTMNVTRSGVKERDLDIFVDVLNDMIQTDNAGLESYDWLGTTVNIQGATLKVLELTQLVLRKKYINPSDLELLKYIIYLFKQASIIHQYNEVLRMKLPRGKNMKRKIIKTKGLIDRVWLYRQSPETENNMYRVTRNDVEIFGQFLDELLNSLYELHTAIKEIASITKYNRQNWYKNLKELYLNRTRDRTLEVLLHLTVNRVLDLVEDSAKNGLEKNYVKFVKLNDEEVGRTVNEFVFLMKILNEIENDK